MGQIASSKSETRFAHRRNQPPGFEVAHRYADSIRITHNHRERSKNSLASLNSRALDLPTRAGYIAILLPSDRQSWKNCRERRSCRCARLSFRLPEVQAACVSPNSALRARESRCDQPARKTRPICRPQGKDLVRENRTPSASCRAWRNTRCLLRPGELFRCRSMSPENSPAAILPNGTPIRTDALKRMQ